MAKTKDNSLSKEMQQKIANYGNEIVAIEDQVEAVRQIPDVYIGALGNSGYLTMVREILQNSLDEILKGNSPNNLVYLWFDQRTKTVCVQDFSRGIPHGKIVTIFGQLHTSSNYNKADGEFSAGKNGQGGSLVNMLSSKFIVESYQLGKGKKVEFTEGHAWAKGEVDIPNSEGKQGAIITFTPSFKIIGDITVTWEEVYDLIFKIVPTVPVVGTTVKFTGTDADGINHVEDIVNSEGIVTHLYGMTQSPLIKPIYFSSGNGQMKGEVVFTYDSTFTFPTEEVMGFCNTCPTERGTHTDGFVDGLTKFFRDYMNKIYLANSRKKITIVGNDVRAGLKAVVSVFHLKAKYTGQSKEILSNEDIRPFVASLVYQGLEEWCKTNSADLQKICKYIKDVADLRMKTDDSKIKLSTKYESSILNGGLPAKYVRPNKKANNELIIVEGDSALGSLKNSRNKDTQGIFPIRGKLPNAFTTTREKFLGNAEVAAIITIIGADYGKNCDPNKCKFEKVIIGTDADPDGAHIRSLILRFFLLYLKPLVEAGILYSSVPPLYGAKINNKMKYFVEKIDFVKYTHSVFCTSNEIKHSDGSAISKSDIIDILYSNIDYVAEMESVADTYAVDPYLLEFLLAVRNYSFKDFKKIVKDAYRFLEVDSKNGITVVSGLVGEKFHTIVFNDRMMSSCSNIIRYIDQSPKNFLVNGTMTNLYGLMKTFEKSMPSNITRYKGLGEMNPGQLNESTFSIENRTLLRFNVEDIKKEIDGIRYLETNKNELLKDIKVTKQDLM